MKKSDVNGDDTNEVGFHREEGLGLTRELDLDLQVAEDPKGGVAWLD